MNNSSLSKKAVEEYRIIYKKFYGEEISYEQAAEQGIKLIRFFNLIYRPIKASWIKKHGK